MGSGGGMRRDEFLRLLGMGMSGALVPAAVGALWARDRIVPGEDDLVRRTPVFDGVVSLSTRRGEAALEFRPGTVSSLTGIDLGNMTTRVQRLETLNGWVAERSAGIIRVLRVRDLSEALEAGRYGVVFYVQQAFDVELHGSVEPIARWKEAGLRALQITYHDNLLGGGAGSDEVRLTALGRRVVGELNRLNMVVDVSHSGRRTTLDVAAASAAPITANHANARRLTAHRRNKTDEEFRAIAATGGVVGITAIGRFIIRDTARPATIDDFVAHVDHVVETIGVDHVGISSDGYLDGTHVFDIDYSDRYLNAYERWVHVTERLRSRGYTDLDLKKILGLNFLRVHQEVLDP